MRKKFSQNYKYDIFVFNLNSRKRSAIKLYLFVIYNNN